MRNKTACLLMAAVLCGGNAIANDVARQLTDINHETTLLKAEIEREKARLELQDLKKPKAPPAAVPASAGAATPVPSTPVRADMPTVISVEGFGAKRFALLRMPGGGYMEVVEGDDLGAGRIVQTIEANRVSVLRGTSLVHLDFEAGVREPQRRTQQQ